MIDIWCGRAHRLWAPMVKRIADSYAAGADVLVLVPEQYTLQAERDLMRDMGVKGFFRLDVLSPTRLQFRVLDALGQDPRVPIDERGKAITVARALQQVRQGLHYYQGAHERQGLIQQMSSLLSTLRSLNLRPEQLQELAQGRGEGGLAYKLRDSALVLARYEALLSDQYADQQAIHQDVLRRLQASQLYRQAEVYVYGFDILTEPLTQTLLALGAQARQLTLTMVCDRLQAPDGEAFQAVHRSLNRFMDGLKEKGLKHRFQWLTPEALQAPAEIAHLERELLGVHQPAFEGPAPAIRIYAASTPYQEAQHLARECLLQLRGGVQAEQIMVICGSLPQYASLIQATFADWGIPCYIADRSPLSAHAIVRYLLAALRCAADGWRREDVNDLIKSGLSDLAPEEAWQLENYALQYGIAGRRWISAFTRGEAALRARMEPLRQRLTAPVIHLHKQLVAAQTAGESLSAAREFLSLSRLEDKAAALDRQLGLHHMPKEAMQLRQVLGKLGEVFDQLIALMADERVPIKHFATWLEAALSETDIGSLPPERQMVQVGQLGNLLVNRPRVVFVLGLNDGVLGAPEDLLLTRAEVEQVEAQLNVSLGLSPQAKEEMALLDLWKALSAPGERLFLSYALANEEGGALRPLTQLKLIQRMFGGIIEEGGALASEREDQALPPAPAPALDAIASRWREGQLSGPWQEAWAWLCQHDSWRAGADRLSGALSAETPIDSIGQEKASHLYPEGSSSVSRLESFALCPYQHFMRYGLRPLERQAWQVSPVDRGNFYHAALERFVRLAIAHPQWPQVSRQESEQLMDEGMAPLLAVWEELPYLDTHRQKWVSMSYQQLLRRMAWTITQGAQASSFRPEDTELRFGQGAMQPAVALSLPDGQQLQLHGTIDRVDRYVGPLGAYLRIVDYKSGRTAFDPAKVWEGAQLQLLIYLQAALLADPGAQPAGAFYQWLGDPIINTEDEHKVDEQILSALRMSGMALSDEDVVRLMDADQTSLGKLFNKDGSPGKGKALLDLAGFEQLCAHGLRRAGELAQRILRGDAVRSPLFDAARRGPCEHCRFGGICRIDALDGRGRRRMPKMALDELLQRAQDEAEGNSR